MSMEKQIELLIVWKKNELVLRIKKFGCLISLRMLLTLVLKIIVSLYIIVCVGSFVRSFFLSKKKKKKTKRLGVKKNACTYLISSSYNSRDCYTMKNI